MKNIAVISLMLIVLLLPACAGTLSESSPAGNTEIIDVRYNEINDAAQIDDSIVPFYLPHQLSDGTKITCSLNKQGSKAVISTGDQTLVNIDYYEAASNELSGAPELRKAALTSNVDSFTIVMLLNPNLGCVMESSGISKQELINTADSFYLYDGPIPAN